MKGSAVREKELIIPLLSTKRPIYITVHTFKRGKIVEVTEKRNFQKLNKRLRVEDLENSLFG